MKKGTFTIATNKGFKEVNGYTHSIGTLEFGFAKAHSTWNVTELFTGMAVCSGHTTRKAALEAAEKIAPKVFDLIASNNERINKMQEAMKEYKKSQEGEEEMKQTKKGTRRNQ